MRTTVTLEPDLAARLKEYAHRRRTSFEAALNAMVRRGLLVQKPPASSRRRFVVKPHSSPFRPGIDSAKLNRLADQLEAENAIAGSESDAGGRLARLERQGLVRRATVSLRKGLLSKKVPRAKRGASLSKVLLEEKREDR